MKVTNTINDITLKSKLYINQTLINTEKSFLYINLGFTESHLGVLSDFPGFVQLILGSYKSDKPIDNTGVEKVHLGCNCFNGSLVNSI